MRDIISKFGKWDWLIVVFLGILYYLLVRQYIPCYEDFENKFIHPRAPKWEVVSSLSDAMVSQVSDYNLVNGRYLVGVSEQLFCGETGPIPFFIISTFMFIMLLIGLTWLIRNNGNTTLFDIPLISLLILLLAPEIGATFYGHVTFVVNYLWSSCLYVWFVILFLLLKENKIKLTWHSVLLIVLFAILCGHWHEAFSFGIFGAIVLYYIFNHREITKPIIFLMSGFALGLLTAFVAPGNYVKLGNANGTSMFSISHLLNNCIQVGMSGPFLTFVVLVAIIAILKRKTFFVFIKDNWLYFIAAMITLFFAIAISYLGGRQLMMVTLFSVVVFARAFSEMFEKLKKNQVAILVLLLVVSSAIQIRSIVFRGELYDNYQEFYQSAMVSTDSVADCNKIELWRVNNRHSYFNRFCNGYIHFSYLTSYWHKNLSHTITCDSTLRTTVALPFPKKEIANMCNNENLIMDCLYDCPFDKKQIIIKVPCEVSYDEMLLDIQTLPISKRDVVMNKINGSMPTVQRVDFKSLVQYREFEYGESKFFMLLRPYFLSDSEKILYAKVIF